jgi:hypothetical protein
MPPESARAWVHVCVCVCGGGGDVCVCVCVVCVECVCVCGGGGGHARQSHSRRCLVEPRRTRGLEQHRERLHTTAEKCERKRWRAE